MLPNIKTSFVEQDSLDEIIAIWGIEGGVAKAKLASIPIIQIVASRLSEVEVERSIVLATVATKVAVTILDDKLVWIAAHKAKIIRSKIGDKLINELPKFVWRKVIKPISVLFMASPSASVAAHMIKLPQGTPFLKASPTSIKGLLSILIIHKISVPRSGGITVPYLLKNS